MINRGKKNVYFEIFTKAFVCAVFVYFTLGLAWVMGKGQIIAFWQMAKGWF